MSLVELIAGSLQLSESYVRGVASSASYRYFEFQIKKADGRSFRKIEQPSKELKLFQRWLVRNVFDRIPTHPSAHAYVRGKSIRTNASVHQGSRYISRLDFANFFPSITSTDVELLLRRNPLSVGSLILKGQDILLISKLTCRFGRLSIGAPSSPTISNKLLYELDTQFSAIASSQNANYTSYADDLYFSSSVPDVLQRVCNDVERAAASTTSPHLTINRSKTYHASRKKRMAVTGLKITPQGALSVGRDVKRRLRILAHKTLNKKIQEKDSMWLQGMLAFVASIEPRFVERIRLKYGIK